MNIFIRLPNWLGDIVMSFPFLHALRREFPDAQLACIVKPAYKDLLTLLPFETAAVCYDRRQDGMLPRVLRRCEQGGRSASAIDLYFCLPPSFSSAFMGRALNAVDRIGYAGQWRSAFFTHTTRRTEGEHRAREYLNLLKLYTGRDFAEPGKILSHALDPYFPDTRPYIAVNVNSEAPSRRLPGAKWVQFLAFFKGRRFVFIGEGKERGRVEELLGLLPVGGNEYVNLAGKTTIVELARLLAHCRGLLTNDSGPAHLASYVGAPVVVFFGAGDAAGTGPTYAGGRTLIVKEPVPCSPCRKNECRIKTLDCLNNLSMRRVMQETCGFLDLS